MFHGDTLSGLQQAHGTDAGMAAGATRVAANTQHTSLPPAKPPALSVPRNRNSAPQAELTTCPRRRKKQRARRHKHGRPLPNLTILFEPPLPPPLLYPPTLPSLHPDARRPQRASWSPAHLLEAVAAPRQVATLYIHDVVLLLALSSRASS